MEILKMDGFLSKKDSSEQLLQTLARKNLL
jgi:hypothetical protein